jgi:hypothetical protein
MAQKSDWLPNSRQEQLIMAKNWIAIFGETVQNAQNTGVKKYAAWGIPQDVFIAFGTAYSDALSALQAAQNEETRSKVTNAHCKTAFTALAAKMRDIKKRWFYEPPLTAADIVSLGLRPRDTTPTPSGTPTAQAAIETFLIGRRQLGIKVVYVTGNPADISNKGSRVWYSVIAQGETPPVNPDELRKSFYTKRKKDLIDFEFGDSGKTAYFAVQIENEGKKGPWGPLVSALIP